MKYIVFSLGLDGMSREVPVMFPNCMVHIEVARSLVAGQVLKGNPIKVVSAGEYCPFNGACSGESTTLMVKSRGDIDTKLIQTHDYTGGFQ